MLATTNPIATSRVADATVLTVAWRETSQENVTRAVEMLRAAGAPLVEIVLNKTDLAKIGRYDGKQYSDYSYCSSYQSTDPGKWCADGSDHSDYAGVSLPIKLQSGRVAISDSCVVRNC